ncbi:hypothetical protein Q7C36_016317 [Tachysurus vachellii]|uniref:Uncharacterized protein n=1 Tax=Tachysurus vachellii TaxID=175792 RepID=A0AA88M5R1_TACVA|nr:hypothetical protein Q7C36_016317 [Tachysurus vachellii]
MSHRSFGRLWERTPDDTRGTVKPVRNKQQPSPARGADLAEREPPSFGRANLEGRTGRPLSFLDRRGGVGRLPSRGCGEGHLTPGPSGGWGARSAEPVVSHGVCWTCPCSGTGVPQQER